MPAGLYHENYRSDERIFQTWFVRIWLIAFLIACVLFPFFGSEYMIATMIEVGIAIIACHGLNLLTGFTGQISLGHAAFMGVGAYTCSILVGQAGVPFIVALFLAGFVTALVGMVFGIPSLRLRGLYLAMATIAAQFIIEFTIRRWDKLTGGVEGMYVDPGTLGPFHFDDRIHLYYLTFVLALAVTIATKNIIRSRSGRASLTMKRATRSRCRVSGTATAIGWFGLRPQEWERGTIGHRQRIQAWTVGRAGCWCVLQPRQRLLPIPTTVGMPKSARTVASSNMPTERRYCF